MNTGPEILFRSKFHSTSAWVVTEMNDHRDKRSSEIMTQKPLKGLNNNATQTKSYGKYCFSICCYLVCTIFIFTLFKFETFEDRLSL